MKARHSFLTKSLAFAGILAITSGAAFAHSLTVPFFKDEAEPNATVKGVQDYLEEFSAVMDSEEGRGRVLVSTNLSSDGSQRDFELIYERTQYETAETPTPLTHQLIYYFFKLNDLNPSSVVVREWAGSISGRPYFYVFSQVDPRKEYIEYTNLFEQRLSDGSVDVTTSRGKARTLVLGYFTDEEEARRFSNLFRDLLAHAGEREKVSSPEGDNVASRLEVERHEKCRQSGRIRFRSRNPVSDAGYSTLSLYRPEGRLSRNRQRVPIRDRTFRRQTRLGVPSKPTPYTPKQDWRWHPWLPFPCRARAHKADGRSSNKRAYINLRCPRLADRWRASERARCSAAPPPRVS